MSTYFDCNAKIDVSFRAAAPNGEEWNIKPGLTEEFLAADLESTFASLFADELDYPWFTNKIVEITTTVTIGGDPIPPEDVDVDPTVGTEPAEDASVAQADAAVPDQMEALRKSFARTIPAVA